MSNNNIYISNNFNLTSHDYSVSVIYHNKVYSIELERFIGIKHFGGKIIYSNKYDLYQYFFYLIKKILNITDFNKDYNLYIFNDFSYYNGFQTNFKHYTIYEHHLLHASSTYYPSGYKESAILVIDAYGMTEEGRYESQSMWYGDNLSIKKIYSNISKSIKGIEGIGKAYITYSTFIGLEEGSVMGLSSYGNPQIYSNIEIYKYHGDDISFDGSINLEKIYGITKKDYLDKKNDITKSIFADVSAHIQLKTEEAIVYLANKLYEKTKCKNLCLAGGVALNIIANTKILEKTKFENIFVQPATNDGGLSLGAVYYGYHILGKNTDRIPLISPGLGILYSNETILKILKQYGKYISYNYKENIEEIGGDILSKGNIIGWFQGGSEFGPRSLGNRSILADSRSIKIRDRVNKIKNRQKWRPLAPVILEEFLGDYFELNIKSPYMTFSSQVKEKKKKIIPGVIHIDGTSRYQTISKKINSKYYNLLKYFNKNTGIPILINTSFNISRQPIVESPKDAIEMFISTDLDYLLIGNYIVSKNNKNISFKFNYKEKIDKILFKNISDKKKYNKKWNLLKKIFFNKLENVILYYGDNSTILFYNINSFGFILDNKFKIIIEHVNCNSGYLFEYQNIGIKIDGTKLDINYDNKLKKIIFIVQNNYKLIFNIIKGKKLL